MDRRRMWWAAGAGGAVLVAGVVTLALLSDDDADKLPVRAREYTDVRVCLLTDGQGVAGKAAVPVWAGMQDASAKTHAQVSWLKVTGEASAGRAQIFANTLLQQKCSAVIGVGEAQGQALRAVAPANPKVRFAVVGQGGSAGNLTVVEESSDVRGSVARFVTESAG